MLPTDYKHKSKKRPQRSHIYERNFSADSWPIRNILGYIKSIRSAVYTQKTFRFGQEIVNSEVKLLEYFKKPKNLLRITDMCKRLRIVISFQTLMNPVKVLV